MDASRLLRRKLGDAEVRGVAHVVLRVGGRPRGAGAHVVSGRIVAIEIGRCGTGVTAEIARDVAVETVGSFIARAALTDFIDTVMRVPQTEAVSEFMREGLFVEAKGGLGHHDAAHVGGRDRIPGEGAE